MEALATSKELQIDISKLQKTVLLIRAINNKNRLKVLHLLHENKRMTVTDLYKKLRVEQPVTSQHLAVLRKFGFVQTERVGKCVYYSINYDRLKEVFTLAVQF